jgi:hypothetical protein
MYYFNFKFQDISITLYFTVFKRYKPSEDSSAVLKNKVFVFDLSVIS